MRRIVVCRQWHYQPGQVPWNRAAERVRLPSAWQGELLVNESSCLGLQLKAGGKFHLKLNIGGRPIAYKYREGKMQKTLKRELKST
jgi:hypothetical protein